VNESKELYIVNKDIAEKFIDMVKKEYDLQLDFSRDSIPVFEKAADTLKNIKGEIRESIKVSMVAYVGQLLLTLFGGEWFEGDVAVGVYLKTTGLGEKIKVYPSAWVEKRLSSGRAAAIEYKIAVLTDVTLIEHRYEAKWSKDVGLSEQYAKRLDVCVFDKSYVDKLLYAIMDKPNVEHVIDLNSINIQALKYLRGRLIKLHDIHPFGSKLPVRISEINKCFPKQKLVFDENEFLALLEYLQDSHIDSNGELFKNIWSVEKDSSYFKKSKTENHTAALIWLLKLISKKNYHHDIVDFKKVLELIKPENEEIIRYLATYKLKYAQGCYKAIKYIIDYNFHGDLFSNFNIQRQVIIWLDNASGGNPKKPWNDKLSIIEQICLPQDLSILCQWILAHDELRYDEENHWLDSVFTRFQKSSKWYQG